MPFMISTERVQRNLNNMAKKDFDEYFNQQYKAAEMALAMISEYVALGEKQMMSQQQIDNAKKAFQPVIDSYKFLEYVKYLLDKPSKNQKKKLYEKQHKKQSQKYSAEELKKISDACTQEFKEKFLK